MFQPWVSCYRGFTPVAVVVQQLFSLVYISWGDEDQVRYSIDVMELGLTVAVFAVVDEPSHAVCFFCGVNTEGYKENS